MKKFITGLLSRNKQIGSIILLGLDAAGKTTILYKMKLGEIETVIPTIGFNLEILNYKEITIKCWDVGGCDKIRPLWRHYFEGMEALVYVVDSNDRERTEEANTELHLMMKEVAERPFPIPVLVFVNKQDRPNCMSAAEVADKLGLKNIKNHHVQASCAINGDGLYEGFDWLSEAITKYRAVTSGKSDSSSSSSSNSNSNSNSNSAPPAAPPPANGVRPPPSPPFLSPSDSFTNLEFLQALDNYTLPSWDHKTHIRIAYTNLKRHGRREGVKKIRQGLQNFIANSSITNKNRYHETMTYFWIQMTHFAMSTCQIPLMWEAYDEENGLPEFNAFLERNVHLMNGGLFLEYYTRELMLNTMASREQFAVPDIQPLPNIVHIN